MIRRVMMVVPVAALMAALAVSSVLPAFAQTAPIERSDAKCEGSGSALAPITGTDPVPTAAAHTFTAENGGKLTTAKARVRDTLDLGNLVLEIRSTDASGVPTLSVLASASFPASEIPSNYTELTASFSSEEAPVVVAGQQYALVLRATDGGVFNWSGSVEDVCPGNAFTLVGDSAVSHPDVSSLFFSTFVTTTPQTNNAPVAKKNSYKVKQGNLLRVRAPGILKNDTDADGDKLKADLATRPEKGKLTYKPNGSFVYKPKKNFVGEDSFTYSATDGVASSDVVKVKIRVRR